MATWLTLPKHFKIANPVESKKAITLLEDNAFTAALEYKATVRIHERGSYSSLGPGVLPNVTRLGKSADRKNKQWVKNVSNILLLAKIGFHVVKSCG